MNTIPFIDAHNRTVRYLRLSITDRCNLSCMYCSDSSYIPHSNIMRYEEMERMIALVVPHGIDKVRLTGGEPFARKGLDTFLEKIRNSYPQLDIRITTNGTLLKPYIPLIKDLNIKINLSLDSLKNDLFTEVTGKNFLPIVLENMYNLIDYKIPLKINAVALKGKNESELPEFINLAKNNPLDFRFIEFMPMGSQTLWNQNLFWSAEDILSQANKITTLTPIPRKIDDDTHGPAKLYSIENGKGRFGIITPLSSHFCSTCNRLRITSDGKLRTCLFDDTEYNLLPMLRNNKVSDKALIKLILNATLKKQIGAELLKNNPLQVARKKMVTIGG